MKIYPQKQIFIIYSSNNKFHEKLFFYFVSDKIKNGANVCLLLLTLMAVYSHYMVDDKLERTAPALVFLFMLTGRLVVYWQVIKRNITESGETAQANGGFKQE